ncbi:MAG: NAD(P)-dependent oxidoreductase [Candidatus Omnitrophota bacterium]
MTYKNGSMKILVTPKEACELLSSLPKELFLNADIAPTFGRVHDTNKLIDLLKDKAAVILDLEKIDAEVLSNCPNLKIISRFGEGCDAIDLEAAKKFEVRVARTRGVASLAVARHAMSLVLSLTHNVVGNNKNLKEGQWARRPNLSEESLTLGILGFGKIGAALADLASSFGFNVIIHSHSKPAESRYKFAESIDELAGLSDILSINLPLTPQTKHLVSKELIQKLKGKFIVNTSRGGLVDEEALFDSLESEGVTGYATDVFLAEPLSGISRRLAEHPKVICSPHIAAFDRNTAVNMTRRALENALNCLQNKHDKVVSYVI